MARALRIDEIDALLDARLEDPQAVLEVLVTQAAKGHAYPELWEKLHAAVVRDDQIAELAFAYEHLAQDRRTKLLGAEQQADVFLYATRFFADVFGDPDGAIGYAERVLAAVPGHPEAFSRLEQLLGTAGDAVRLGKLYLEIAQAQKDKNRQLELVRQAVELLSSLPDAEAHAIEALTRLVRLDPLDGGAVLALEQKLSASGKPREAAKLLEQALMRDPAPRGDEARALHGRLLSLYSEELREPHRAVPHVEALLADDPSHERALALAEALLENRQVAARVAPALSDAYERLGRPERAAEMLGMELKLVRGPRRLEAQRRLALIRQDVLGDPAGALELLGPVCAADPSDDDVRRRFVELSISLNQPAEAARLLSRAVTTCRDPAVRARVGADVGSVYLRSGDLKRARAALEQVIEDGADPGAMIAAARQLVSLHDSSGDTAALAQALEVVAKHEPDAEPRYDAARRLARLCESEIDDPARAISAWRALVESPWADEALRRLGTLYEQTGDQDGQIDVIEHRARRLRDPKEARELAFQAAELRTSRGRDRAAALASWRAFVAQYGPSRDAHARMIPLLEQDKQFKELAWVLERELELAPASDAAALHSRLAQIRLLKLDEPEAALGSLARALEADPKDAAARALAEKLLSSGTVRLAAADVLEPIYRREPPGPGLLRVLEVRAELADDPATRLVALERASALASEVGDPARALEIAARALLEVARSDRGSLGDWLARVQQLAEQTGKPRELAALLVAALGDLPIDSPELVELATATADALVRAGDLAAAVGVLRRALEFDPGSGALLGRMDELLAEQGSPEERLALYRSALAQPADPARRRSLLHRMAELQRRELGDLDGAIHTWRMAVEEDPKDWASHEALVDAYAERRDFRTLYAELERALALQEGERRFATLARMAEVAAGSGNSARALEHYRELLAKSELSDEVLQNIELVAHAEGDAETMRSVLERRISVASEPEEQAALLEKLGLVQAKQIADPTAAARSWMTGAALAEGAGDDDRARRLYERVLGVMPDEADAARRLIELYARVGAWQKLPEAFSVLLRTSAHDRDTARLLLSLEEPAAEAGALDVFVELADAVLGLPEQEPARVRQILLAKARLLAHSPAHKDEVAEIYRRVIAASPTDATAVEAFGLFLARAELTPARIADRRWLFEHRAKHAADPTTVLIAWAVAEETSFGSPEAAIEIYERVVAEHPDHVDAIAQLARLKAERGDAEGALSALFALADKSEGETRSEIQRKIAGLQIEQLGRPLDALELLEKLVEEHPTDPEALRLVQAALAFEPSRSRAAALLGRAAESADTPEARAGVFETLLAVSRGSEELALERARWWEQLLDCRADDPRAALEAALAGAEEQPLAHALWDAAERFARKLDRPDPVADAYARALERPLSAEAAEELGRRMVEFHEEWFEDPERVVRLMMRVLELSPGAGWAFDRLKLAFNAQARWEDLFGLYDRALQSLPDDAARIELLREAAMAAKDFAGDADRAIGYLEQLNRIAPGDSRVESALERLYERGGHAQALITLLNERLAAADAATAAGLRERIAGLWLDLGEAIPAWQTLETLLAAPETSEPAFALLERLVALPQARDSIAPISGDGKRDRYAELSVRHAAAGQLKQRYEQLGRLADVARMLEVELELAQDPQQRADRLRAIVELKLTRLADAAGAFENVAQLVALEPTSREQRDQLAALARQIGAEERLAELLSTIADGSADRQVALSLVLDAAAVKQDALADRPGAIELYARVLAEATDRELALTAARQLDGLLESEGPPERQLDVLERLADLESEPDRRSAALGAAARVAMSLHQPERAISAWRQRLAADASDAQALDGLCTALEAAERWPELVEALGLRARAAERDADARRDHVRIATLQASVIRDPAAAIDAWKDVRERYGADRESFEALSALLQGEQRFDELAELIAAEAEREPDPQRRRFLQRDLGDLHENHTHKAEAALFAFVAAEEWSRTCHVVASAGDDALGLAAQLFERAAERWTGAEDEAAREGAATATRFALDELVRRLSEAGQHERVAELLLRAATLPFSRDRRRTLEREAAVICSDRLAAPDRALDIFRRLFAEDAGDEVALGSVTRFALLLESAGQGEELVALWEQQARCRAESGDTGAAAALWARAAELAREKLGDVERAIADHRQGAALGGEASLEALAGIHESRREFGKAAEVLEWLCASSPREQLAARALRLAEAYLSADRSDLARARLEQAQAIALDAALLRQRLAELYREAEDWGALATLLTQESERTADRRTRLALLREVAALHVERQNDPESAVPLLEQAIELDPDATALRLALADAFTRAERFEQATEVLRAQIERYGSRKPKDRALAHFHLARVSLAAGRRAEAIAELDVANKIDPAHPSILQALARLAFEEGQLERAERMYRALLLVLGRADDPDAPSRAEALLDLSEIAMRSEDELRAQEFIESAFEAAAESAREAERLEQALTHRKRYDLLARALESRLDRAASPAEAARALGDLAFLHAEHLGGLGARQSELHTRADGVYRELETSEAADDRAWSALGSVYDWIGDRDAEARVLERRVAALASGTPGPKHADAFYRLAEVQIENPETRASAIEVLERALEIAPDLRRAEATLERVLAEQPVDERTLRVFERVARGSGDEQLLCRALSLRIDLPELAPGLVREALGLAREQADAELERSILERALARHDANLGPEDAAWVRRELAQLRENTGDIAGALALYEQAASHLPPAEARPVLLEVARRLNAEAGDRERAARIYESLLEHEPADRELWEPLLGVYQELGDGARLVQLIDRTVPLVDSIPDRARLRFEQAKVLLSDGQTDAALELLREIVEDDPSLVEAAELLGGIYREQGRVDELVVLLSGQLDSAKDRQDVAAIVEVSRRLGTLLESQDRAHDAFDVYLAVLDWDKSSPDVLRAVLRLAEQRDDPFLIADAIEGLLKIERGEPAVELAQRLVALRDEQFDSDGAERALELGFLASPSTAELREPLLERYTQKGDVQGLARVLREAALVAPEDRELVLRMVEAQRQADHHAEGLEVVERLIESAPDDVELVRARAALLSDLGRDEEALSALERAYELSPSVAADLAQALENAVARTEPPEDRRLTLRLIEVLEQSGDVVGARARLAELVKLSPKDREAVERLAELEERAESWDGAVAAYRRLIPLVEGEAVITTALKLADACERAGRFGDARGGLERALKLEPEHPVLRERLRALFEATGANRELAELVLADAAAEQQVAKRLELLLRAGELLLSPDGSPQDAVRVLEEARGLSPESVPGVVLLARAHAACGRIDESRALLSSVVGAQRGRRSKPLAAVYREMSRLELEEGLLSEALVSLTKAFEMDMRNARLAMELGQLALDLDEEEIASRAFRAVTMLKPGDEDAEEGVTPELRSHAQFQLAVLSAKKGDARRARVLVSKALTENPEHEQARQLLAELEAT